MNVRWEPVGFGDLELGPLTHGEDAAELAWAADDDGVEGSEDCVLEGGGEGVQVDSEEHPHVFLYSSLLQGISKREVLQLLLPLHGRNINPLLIAIQIINPKFNRPIPTYWNEHL